MYNYSIPATENEIVDEFSGFLREATVVSEVSPTTAPGVYLWFNKTGSGIQKWKSGKTQTHLRIGKNQITIVE